MIYHSFHISKGGIVKKLFWVVVVLIATLFLWEFQKHKKNVITILPEKTVFFIDDSLSSNLKKDLMSSIESLYLNLKNPEAVIKETNDKFTEIASMTVQICQSDKICFYLDAAPAVFLLNDQFVICENGASVPKDHFTLQAIKLLIRVSSQNSIDVSLMIQFIKKLPHVFITDFSILYEDINNILLISNNDNNFILQVTIDDQVTEQDLNSCKSIGLQLPKKMKAKKKQVVYDLRFKNQIIVR